FLELERAFESDGEMHAAAEIEKIFGAEKLAAEIFKLLILAEDGFELRRDVEQLLDVVAGGLFGHIRARMSVCSGIAFPPYLSEIEGQNGERGELAGESFGGGHADFRARVRVDGAGGFARNHGPDHIADGEGLRAFLFGFALSGEGV